MDDSSELIEGVAGTVDFECPDFSVVIDANGLIEKVQLHTGSLDRVAELIAFVKQANG